MGIISREKEERGSHHASLGERVDFLESLIGDNAEKHAREIAAVATGHQKLQGELKSRGEGHSTVSERVNKLEKAVSDAAERQARELSSARAKLESFSNRFSVVRDAWGQETPRP